MGLWRAVWRMSSLGWHMTMGVSQVVYLHLSHGKNWYQTASGSAVISRWMTQLANIIGLRISVISPPLPVPAMIVANHVSWLDVVAIASVRPAQFLAKDSVRRWPLIGALAASCGTHFIRRNSASVLRECNKRLCHSMRIRQHVVIFPEGTTTDGMEVGVFHPALFESACQAYCPIQPLAIRYHYDNGIDVIAPYVGDELFIVHLWKIIWRKQTSVELRFLPPISSRSHRGELAFRSRQMIVAALEKGGSVPSVIPALQPISNCFATTK